MPPSSPLPNRQHKRHTKITYILRTTTRGTESKQHHEKNEEKGQGNATRRDAAQPSTGTTVMFDYSIHPSSSTSSSSSSLSFLISLSLYRLLIENHKLYPHADREKQKCYRKLKDRCVDLDDDRPPRKRAKMELLAGGAGVEPELEVLIAAAAGCDLHSSLAPLLRCRDAMKCSRCTSNASKASCICTKLGLDLGDSAQHAEISLLNLGSHWNCNIGRRPC